MKTLLSTTSAKYLARLAKTLNTKADVYCPICRLCACDGRFVVKSDDDGISTLFFVYNGSGSSIGLVPGTLFDGNGRAICVSRES